MTLERKQVYQIEQVLVHVRGNTNVRDKSKLFMAFDGDQVKIRSDRLLTFKRKGTKCVKCGCQGKFFAKERVVGSSGYWHMNLYAMKDGKEVLMTKDHIVPKAKGGASALYNYQPMCSRCNGEKADTMPKAQAAPKWTKESLQKEIDKLKSILGGKDGTISNLTRDKSAADNERNNLRRENEQLKTQNTLLRKRVKQLAELLANPE